MKISSLEEPSERHSRTSIGSLVGSGRETQNQGGLLNLQHELGAVHFFYHPKVRLDKEHQYDAPNAIPNSQK